MSHGKHTNLGLGILIGGLATALLLRHPPDNSEPLPELQSTKVLERDFALEFEDEPILPSEIDEFESLYPLDLTGTGAGARLQGIEVAGSPERDRPIPGEFPLKERPLRGTARGLTEPDEATEQAESSVPTRPINAKGSEVPVFLLPDNLITEPFLQEEVHAAPAAGDAHPPAAPTTTRRPSSPTTGTDRPAARVIVPPRVRLGEPHGRQAGTGRQPGRQDVPRSVAAQPTAAEAGLGEINSALGSTTQSNTSLQPEPRSPARDRRDILPSLEGLDPLPLRNP
jgi:hypothetical protein